MEHCRLIESPDGVQLVGTVITMLDGIPLLGAYDVRCDAGWRTQRVMVALDHGGVSRRLLLEIDADGRWRRDGHEIAALAGCVDVDLGATPATNTLPIRRLALEVGSAHDLTAAWVRFPSLEVMPLTQRYTRLDHRRWRYESRGGAFSAELDVDDRGLVVRYPPAWERVRGPRASGKPA